MQNEEVMSLSKDSLIDTINSSELENTVQSNAVKERLGFVSGEYSLRVVTDNSRSTRSILYELYEDSSVVYAEPNYIPTPPDDMGNDGAYFRATNVEPKNDEGGGDKQSGNGTSVIEGVTRKVTKAPKTGDDFLTL